MEKKKYFDMDSYKKYLEYVPALLFSIVLIVKLVELSKMTYLFPSYDWSGHITTLFFLKEYGFHNIASNWYYPYGGEIVLSFYPPLFFFYSLIFYTIINNVQVAFYISFVLVHLISLIGAIILGKVLNFSLPKTLLLFFFFHANIITIPWFYINGRIPEMFAWTLSFYLLALLFYYKDKFLDKKFYILLPTILSLILLSHPLVLLLLLFILLGFFIIRNNKDKIKIFISCLFVPLLSSFWLIDFVKSYDIIKGYIPAKMIYNHPTEIIYSIIIPLIFFLIFYLYIKVKNISKKEILFYLPIIFISLIYLTHVFLLIPIFRSIEPRIYGILFLLISSILFLSLKINKKYEKFFNIIIIILSLLIFLASLIRYEAPSFSLYTEKNKEILDILPKINGSFIVIGENNYDMHHVASIAAVKYNLTTPFGWGMREIQKEVEEDKSNLKNSIDSQNCELLKETLNKLKVKEIISYKDKCDFLISCGLNRKSLSQNYCHLVY